MRTPGVTVVRGGVGRCVRHVDQRVPCADRPICSWTRGRGGEAPPASAPRAGAAGELPRHGLDGLRGLPPGGTQLGSRVLVLPAKTSEFDHHLFERRATHGEDVWVEAGRARHVAQRRLRAGKAQDEFAIVDRYSGGPRLTWFDAREACCGGFCGVRCGTGGIQCGASAPRTGVRTLVVQQVEVCRVEVGLARPLRTGEPRLRM